MILYCVRHGETTFNVEGRLQGHSDLSVLSELGRQQSEATGRALRGKPIEAIYASPLRRAFETAEIIGRILSLEVQPDPRLKEIDVGVFQGQLRTDLEKHQAEPLRRWLSGDPEYVIPGGESRRQLAQRGREAFEAIFHSGHRHVAVVSHGGLLVSTIKSLLGIPLRDPPLALENCSLTSVSWADDGRAELVSLNQTEHLAGIGHGGIGDLAV